jgi:Ca-activated chloride channel family protein
MPARIHTIDHASEFVSRLDADGGTVMLPALALALNEQPEMSRVRQIIFLTDGNVDNEQALFSLIEKQLGDNRLFTVGIGSAPNSYFMRKAARAGRGTFTYIADINQVRHKTDALLQKLEQPALVNIDLRLEGLDVEIFPEPVPDLYIGEPLSIVLRGKDIGREITVYGDYGDSSWQQTVDLSTPSGNTGIRTAWARSRIGFLMEQHHDAQSEYDRDRIRQQIIESSVDHHLLSRYTSLVAVDVTPVNSSGALYSEKLKTSLPHGWQPARTGPLPEQQILVAQLNLPQTATRAPMHIMIASMLFALAMVFYLWRKML